MESTKLDLLQLFAIPKLATPNLTQTFSHILQFAHLLLYNKQVPIASHLHFAQPPNQNKSSKLPNSFLHDQEPTTPHHLPTSMTETTTNNSNISRRKRRRRHENPNTEDRLSLLPDSILSHILSLLPTKTAASTSVLSRRWHQQWFNITNLRFDYDLSEHSSRTILSYVQSILSQLTSPNLHTFYLVFPSESNIDELHLTEPCFQELHRRSVNQIIFNSGFRSFFRVPAACLFSSHSLVSLKLIGFLKIECDHGVLSAFRLPKLKNLSLCYLIDVPDCFSTLFTYCPCLEVLELSFDLVSLPQPRTLNPLVNVVSPNLKSLEISMTSWSLLERTVISIDAPKLSNLQICDFNSIYSFVRSPISLVHACIDLRCNSSVEFNDDGEEDNDYVDKMFEFFRRMSSVVNLELLVDCHTNVFTRLCCRITPLFGNLVRIKTNCFKDLMFSLHCFPNLEHLEVSLWSEGCDFLMERRDWCAPDCIPDCLASKLKTIDLGGIKGVGDDIEMVAYILSSAMFLEKLCIAIRIEVNHETGHAVAKECQFCKVLNLPRSSSACEVVVSRSITERGGTVKIDSEASCCPKKCHH